LILVIPEAEKIKGGIGVEITRQSGGRKER